MPTTADLSPGSSPAVTVIIPAFNEERWLPVCLRRLTAGTLPRDRYEILVIDNGSTDRTPEIAARFADRVITVKGGNVSTIRNQAATLARGEVLAFLDADCIPADDWLEAGLASIHLEPCVTGAPYYLPENPAWVERDWEPVAGSSPSREKTNFVPAGNLFIHRERFHQLGGFNPSLSAGEDKELCLRASRDVPVYHDNRIRVVHEGNPKTLRQFMKREIWHGRGILESLRTNWRDKVSACTFAFAASTLLQLAGLIALLFWSSPWLLIAGTLGVLGTLTLVLAHRRRQLKGPGHTIRYAFLNYVYFLGRSVALFNNLFSIHYYHGITSTKGTPKKSAPEASPP